MIKLLTREEFKSKFGSERLLGIKKMNIDYYLDNGVVILESDWNGDNYVVDTEYLRGEYVKSNERFYIPVCEYDEYLGFYEVIGFEE